MPRFLHLRHQNFRIDKFIFDSNCSRSGYFFSNLELTKEEKKSLNFNFLRKIFFRNEQNCGILSRLKSSLDSSHSVRSLFSVISKQSNLVLLKTILHFFFKSCCNVKREFKKFMGTNFSQNFRVWKITFENEQNFQTLVV